MIRLLSIALVISLVGLFIQVYSTSKSQAEIKVYQAKCDSLQHLSDSLYQGWETDNIELSRMRIAYEVFLEKNHDAAMQYGDIISNGTE
jgi:hypothetical protein